MVTQIKSDSKIRDNMKIWDKIYIKERRGTLTKLKGIVKMKYI